MWIDMESGLSLLICILLLVGLHVASTADAAKFQFSDSIIIHVLEKGSNISMLCDYNLQPFGDRKGSVSVLKRNELVGVCYFDRSGVFTPCTSPGDGRYILTNGGSYLIFTITNLQWSDSGNWKCVDANNRLTHCSLLVKASPASPPTGLVMNAPSTPEDLSVNGVDLICSTSNCVYPPPEYIQWLFKEEKGSTWHFYTNSTTTFSNSSCSGGEGVYNSTLSLDTNTTWPLKPTNTDITVKFQCRLDFPTLKSPLISSESSDVKFAVKVTEVVLKADDNSPSCSDITVISGKSTRFSCLTNAIRPPATIIWYIGSVVQQKSKTTEFMYIAREADNGKHIHCKAFNIQKEENAVSSKFRRLCVLTINSTMAPIKVPNPAADETCSSKQTGDGLTLILVIVGVVLGLIIVALALYSTIVTIKLKRKTPLADEARKPPEETRTQTTHVNASYTNDAPVHSVTGDQHYYTSPTTGDYERPMPMYTDLTRDEARKPPEETRTQTTHVNASYTNDIPEHSGTDDQHYYASATGGDYEKPMPMYTDLTRDEARKPPEKTRTQTTHVNASYTNDVPEHSGTDDQHYYTSATGGDYERPMPMYTDLTRGTADDQRTYDIIQKI